MNSSHPIDEPEGTESPNTSLAETTQTTEIVRKAPEKDLSFLLDRSIYHSLSQADVAPPFRHGVSHLSTPSESSISHLHGLVRDGDLYAAAQLSGDLLSGGSVQSTDTETIFDLLGIRYGCLELLGQTTMAASESKSLLDLSSPFYFAEECINDQMQEPFTLTTRRPPEHIMPHELRVQSLRLQSIGFSDPRRGITSLYGLANEIRERVIFLDATGEAGKEGKVWRDHLTELGLRLVEHLYDLGDMECAR